MYKYMVCPIYNILACLLAKNQIMTDLTPVHRIPLLVERNAGKVDCFIDIVVIKINTVMRFRALHNLTKCNPIILVHGMSYINTTISMFIIKIHLAYLHHPLLLSTVCLQHQTLISAYHGICLMLWLAHL